MNGSIVIGKIREIEIEVHFSWLLIFALVTFMLATSYFPQFYPEWDPALMWVLGSLLAVLFFVSILLHELSHSLVSIDQGIPVKKITLFIFGGIAQIERDPDTPLKELKVAIAGPAMSVFLYVLFMSLAFTCDFLEISPAAVVSFNYIATANLVLAIFNLVPAFPLDGGRVLRAIIWHFKGDMQHATKIASSMGSIFGYFLMFNGAFLALAGNIFNGLWFIFIGWFLNQASRSSYQQIVFSDIFKKIHVSEFMTEKIMTVKYYISVQDLVDNYIYKYKYACFPVCRDEQVIGLVDADSVKALNKDVWSMTTVGRITTPLADNLVVSPDATVTDAMAKLFENGVGRVLVMERENLLGIISRTDILNYIRLHSQLS